MANQLGILTFDDLRGGRNGVDTPMAVPERQCVEAINVDFYDARLGRRRKGAVVFTPAPTGFAGPILTLIRHQPFGKETKNELWAIDYLYNIKRCVNTVWSSLGKLPDALPDTDGGRVQWASFNNKLFLAYGSGAGNNLDRMHVFDPATGTIRKGGLGPGTILVPTANPGTGITGTRFYRVAFTQKVGATVVRRGDQSDFKGLAITNQGGWIVKYGALPGEGETHWEVYGAIQGTLAGTFAGWYFISDLPLATTQFVDTTTPANWPPPPAPLAPQIGSNTPLPSAKYLLVDEARLLLAGWWPTAPANTNSYESRVWWTPILYDASQVANDEHINLYLNPYIDFDPGDGGEITGMGGPLFDCPYVFKYNRIYKMSRTGLPDAPYRPVTVSKSCGCIHQRTIVRAEDENGDECLYFLSKRGPYRIGAAGLQYVGRDIEDIWKNVNLDAIDGGPYVGVPGTYCSAHGIYHQDIHQIWWYVPVTTSTFLGVPTVKLVFDVRLGRFTDADGVRGGWAQHRGASCEAYASAVFSRSFDAVNGVYSPTTKPVISQSGSDTSPSTLEEVLKGIPHDPIPEPGPMALGDPRIWQCDAENTWVDVSDTFACRITTRALPISGSLAIHGGVIEGHLLAVSPSPTGAIVTLYTSRDFFQELRASTPVQIQPSVDGIRRYIAPVRDLAAASCAALQILIVDVAGVGSTGGGWQIDELVLRINKQEDR